MGRIGGRKGEDTGKMGEVVLTAASGEIMTEWWIRGWESQGGTVQKDIG